MTGGQLLVVAMIACVFGTLGALLGERVGRKSEGMWLGLLLGPVGMLWAAMLKPIDPAEVARLRGFRELDH